MSVLVIAEAGSCHDGRLIRALDLVEAARDAGVDAVKFQFWSDPERLADRRRVPEHYRAIYRRYQMRPSWLSILQEACAACTRHTQGRRPIEFMATCYLPEDLATVAPFVQRFKVASFEAQDAAFVAAHPRDRDLIVSLGMAENIPKHLDCEPWIELLHCVSSYPAPPEAMNLALLRPRWEDDPHAGPGLYESPFVGLSDHSRDVRMGGLAVAAGARIVEAHLRLDDTDLQNPDYATAFTPCEFAEYVRNIRFADRAIGTSEKRLQDCELAMAKFRVQG